VLGLLEQVSHGLLRALGAKSRFVPAGAGTVHAYELRGGPASSGRFVLLHGMGATATAYTAVVRRLRRHARSIILPDLPGHGRSTLPAGSPFDVGTLGDGLREALDALIPPREPAIVLGTSLGGAAALRYALERPERVAALVLASPAGAPLSDGDYAELRARFALKSRADARRFLAELMHAPPWYLRAIEPGLVELLSHPRVQSFLATLTGDDAFSEAELARLAPPTLVLWGASDRILPRSGLAFYRRALPPSTLFEELPSVGHSPHFEVPGLVARRLLESRRRVRAAPRAAHAP
jgi:pimeloyl-ACP methyl ester carboxylesterase